MIQEGIVNYRLIRIRIFLGHAKIREGIVNYRSIRIHIYFWHAKIQEDIGCHICNYKYLYLTSDLEDIVYRRHINSYFYRARVQEGMFCHRCSHICSCRARIQEDTSCHIRIGSSLYQARILGYNVFGMYAHKHIFYCSRLLQNHTFGHHINIDIVFY